MTCAQTRELFIDAIYNELGKESKPGFDEHLSDCAQCADEYSKLRRTLSIMDKHSRVELHEQEWEDYWSELERNLREEQPSKRKSNIILWRPVPAWAYGIAALLVLTVGIYVGRTYFRSIPEPAAHETTQTVPSSPSVPDSVTQEALAYLERSRNLLIGLSNLTEEHGASVNLSRHQQISRTLVDQGNVLAVALNKPDQQLLKQLIHDLQIILLQLANVEARPGVPVVEFVKKGIDEKSILFKINLEEMRAKSRYSSTEQQPKKENKHL